MTELTFLKELILIKHVYQKDVIFVTISIFCIIVLSSSQVYPVDVMMIY